MMQAIQIKDPSGGSAGLDIIELPIPTLSDPHDILVKVHAVALNPADPKLRSTRSPGSIPGFDGAGVVIEAGTNAQFAKDDEVMWAYAGDLSRNGSHAQYQVIDSRLAGRKPKTLAWDEAAALPVVGLTAWEVFEHKFRLKPDSKNGKEVLLVLGGAGGVGATAIQLAKKVRPSTCLKRWF
jgi:NADPH2:quinone reductase